MNRPEKERRFLLFIFFYLRVFYVTLGKIGSFAYLILKNVPLTKYVYFQSSTGIWQGLHRFKRKVNTRVSIRKKKWTWFRNGCHELTL